MENPQSLTIRLKEVLDSMTIEEFHAKWKEIEELGIEGITCEQLIKSFEKPRYELQNHHQ